MTGRRYPEKSPGNRRVGWPGVPQALPHSNPTASREIGWRRDRRSCRIRRRCFRSPQEAGPLPLIGGIENEAASAGERMRCADNFGCQFVSEAAKIERVQRVGWAAAVAALGVRNKVQIILAGVDDRR